ncbi:MAG: hypothetical protein ACK2UK_11275 [Candidatus Promineifilaceae bacterium]
MNLYQMGELLLNYAFKGGLITAGGGMLLISLAAALGILHQPPTDRLLILLGDYFLIGALIGGLVGLVVIFRQHRS